MTGQPAAFAACFIEIELDIETGMHRIVDLVSVADCGTVIHPMGLATQIKGGAVQGIGMATLERLVYDPQNGLPANVGFHQQKPPSYLDLPTEMFTDAVDKADPSNPVGAKGVGEPLMGASAAALLCAISDAMGGHVFNRTPVLAGHDRQPHGGPAAAAQAAQHQHAMRSSHDVPRHDAVVRALPARLRWRARSNSPRTSEKSWLVGRRPGQLRLVQGPRQATRGADRHHRHRRAQGRPRDRGRARSRRADHAHRDRRERRWCRRSTAVLARAAGRVASPQIRNAATLGGNLCQDARCWYYRAGVDCYRAGGNTCYADTPQGQNREHCLFGAARCIAVTPSDVAPRGGGARGCHRHRRRRGRARGAGRGILHRSGGGHHAA